jgi:hypothetical protein
MQTPSGQELCRPWNIFHVIFIEVPLHNFFFKYQSWYLTPCYGLEMYYPTQAIKSVKCLGGIMHLKPTAGCQISTLIFENKLWGWDLYRYPMKNISRTAKFLPSCHNLFSNIKVDIWHPASGLRCIIPPRHLRQLKTRTIPLMQTPSGQELCRPWNIFHVIFIEVPLHNFFFKYQSWYLYQERQSSCPLAIRIKGLAHVVNWLKCLGGIMDLKPIAGCQISYVI